ncbi:MAG: hypothetical protein AAF617_15915, partial [Bacteroidota bacterium]
KMAVIIALGTVLIAAVYFGKKYKASQKQAEIAEFYNQFSDEAYTAFGKKLEASIHENHPEDFDKSVDIASLFDFSNRDLSGSYNKRKTVEFLGPILKVGTTIHAQLNHPDEFKFTRFYKKNGIPHVVFRSYLSNFINYIDFTLGIKKEAIIITDMYYFFPGLVFSEMASDLYRKVMSQRDFSTIDLSTYESVETNLALGNFEETYSLLRSIPENQRHPYHYQFLLVTAENLDDDTFFQVLEELKTRKPNDQRLHSYLNFKKHIFKGNLTQLNAAIDELKKHVGDDLLFDLYRGFTLNLTADYEQAIPYFDTIITKMPALYEAYYYKLESLLVLNKEKEALSLVAEMKHHFLLQEEDFTLSISDFQEFIQSEAYKNIFKDAE